MTTENTIINDRAISALCSLGQGKDILELFREAETHITAISKGGES